MVDVTKKGKTKNYFPCCYCMVFQQSKSLEIFFALTTVSLTLWPVTLSIAGHFLNRGTYHVHFPPSGQTLWLATVDMSIQACTGSGSGVIFVAETRVKVIFYEAILAIFNRRCQLTLWISQLSSHVYWLLHYPVLNFHRLTFSNQRVDAFCSWSLQAVSEEKNFSWRLSWKVC